MMTHQMYGSTWQKDQVPPIMPSTSKLCTYTGEKIEVMGALMLMQSTRTTRLS